MAKVFSEVFSFSAALFFVFLGLDRAFCSHLDVLIVSTPFAGHAFRVLAIGEELVRKGHNVTLISLDNWVNLRERAIERGMNYMSAGAHGVEEIEWRDFVLKRIELSAQTLPALLADFKLLAESKKLLSFDAIVEYLIALDLKRWDVILTERELLQSIPCIAKSRGIPVITAVSYYSYNTEFPPWPFPSHHSGHSENMTSIQRFLSFVVTVGHRFLNAVSLKRIISGSSLTEVLCHENFKYPIESGLEVPLLVSTVLGLEYPRILLPMTHYVGPLISPYLLSTSLQSNSHLWDWLETKERRSIVYISMGSLVSIRTDLAQAFIDGVKDTNYSVVWSLSELNENVIPKEVKLDPKRYFISSWIPQLALLQHSSIFMAILHGGANGIHEALYHGIPGIVIPFVNDQFDWSIRVEDTGVGIQILPSQVTSSAIRDGIKRIESTGDYHKKAKLMSVLMKRAGGINEAVELIEFYAMYGYDHLIPAPVRYRWNWIVYYNIDVYAVFIVVTIMSLWICSKCCCCCSCLSVGKKSKQS